MGADYALNITSCPHRIFNPSYGPESLSSRLMMLAWYSNFLDPLLRITYYTTELYYQHSSSTNLATATLSFIIFHTVQYKKLSIRWVLLRWMLSMITIFILQCCLDFYGNTEIFGPRFVHICWVGHAYLLTYLSLIFQQISSRRSTTLKMSWSITLLRGHSIITCT